jgi:hypothetical protein
MAADVRASSARAFGNFIGARFRSSIAASDAKSDLARWKSRTPKSSEIVPKTQYGLLTLEMAEIERTRFALCMPGNLDAPGGRHPNFLGKPRVERRTKKQRLSGQGIKGQSAVAAHILTLNAQQYGWPHLPGQGGGNAHAGFVLPGPGDAGSLSIGRANEIEGTEYSVGDKLLICNEQEISPVAVDPVPADIINAKPVRIETEGEPNRGMLPFEDAVTHLDGHGAEG